MNKEEKIKKILKNFECFDLIFETSNELNSSNMLRQVCTQRGKRRVNKSKASDFLYKKYKHFCDFFFGTDL